MDQVNVQDCKKELESIKGKLIIILRTNQHTNVHIFFISYYIILYLLDFILIHHPHIFVSVSHFFSHTTNPDQHTQQFFFVYMHIRCIIF